MDLFLCEGGEASRKRKAKTDTDNRDQSAEHPETEH